MHCPMVRQMNRFKNQSNYISQVPLITCYCRYQFERGAGVGCKMIGRENTYTNSKWGISWLIEEDSRDFLYCVSLKKKNKKQTKKDKRENSL